MWRTKGLGKMCLSEEQFHIFVKVRGHFLGNNVLESRNLKKLTHSSGLSTTTKDKIKIKKSR